MSEEPKRWTEKAAVRLLPNNLERKRFMTTADRTFKLGDFDLKIASMNIENVGHNVIYMLEDDLSFNRQLISDKELLQQYLKQNYRFEIEYPEWLAEYVIEHW